VFLVVRHRAIELTTDRAIENVINNKVKDKFDTIINKNDVTIVIPTLNEETAIGLVIESLLDEEYFNILIVDGYSDDLTLNIAKQYGVEIIYQHGKGKTGAIKTAIEHVKTKYIVIIDGDFTYNATDINVFLNHLNNYDEIIGARKYGRDNIKKLNRFGNWIINKIFNLLMGTNLSDVCSGLYALRTEFARELVLETQGFDVEIEIASQAAINGNITEVPINYGKRLGIQKLQPFRDGIIILTSIIKIARIYNPLVFYSIFGLMSLIPTFLILLWVMLEWFNGIWHSGIALVGVMFALLSFQAFTIGTISMQQKRMEKRILKKLRNYIDKN